MSPHALLVAGGGLTFDAASHTYTTPSGRVIPSVTQILRATGVSVDFEALPNRDAIARKRDIGTALHADAHAYDDQDLDWSTVHPDVRPYLDAWAQFRADKQLQPVARERRVFHPALNYGGTFDGIFTGPGLERPVLIDMKTGDPRAAAAQYQLAGYLMAYAFDVPDAAGFARWSVQLVPGSRVPYRVTAYDDYTDFETWRAIVATYWAAPARRLA